MNAEGITDHSPSAAFLRDAASRGDFRALKERRTRIVATIGPSSSDPETLKAMAAAGLDVARVSFSHGSIDEAIERIRTIRKAIPGIAILADLPGPKVRTTPFGERGAFLEEGQELALAVAALAPSSDATCIGVETEQGFGELEVDDRIIFGDGGVVLSVVTPGSDRVLARVVTSGTLHGKPGVTVPSRSMSLAAPTEEDLERVKALVAEEVEVIAISFVRFPEDVIKVRDACGHLPCQLMAKIETKEAIDNLEEIVKVADAVMVARGDLGVRMPIEEIPSLQKRIIRAGIRYAKPVVTATQMLESMIHATTPTRAEVTDVANAVFDGTSAVMLSAETAIGEHPALVIETMARVLHRAEQDFPYFEWGASLGVQQVSGDRASSLRITAAISGAAWRAAIEEGAAAIIACSSSGTTVRSICRFRPAIPIVAVTANEYRARQLRTSWGVSKVLIDDSEDERELANTAMSYLRAEGKVRVGDVVVVLAGSRHTSSPVTDTVRLIRVE